MTIVVKVGGAVGNALEPVIEEMANRTDRVLVHGGSERADRLGTEMGRPPEYLTSPSGVVSRRSDAAHLEVVTMAIAGAVQTELVAAFARHGARAVGLSGVDGSLLVARRKHGARTVVDGRVLRVPDDLSGTIESVNVPLLRAVLGLPAVPVVGPPAITAAGEVVNVDADRIAAEVAVALGAEALVLLTNVPGLLRNPEDPASRIPEVARDEVDAVLTVATGRMRKKVLAARDAATRGVRTVVIASSRVPKPIATALAGSGTVFR